MRRLVRDAIVVGGGPAGAICASYLSKAGIDVLLLEKDVYTKDVPCGGIMREGFVSHMNDLEVIDSLDTMSTCLRRMLIYGNDGSKTVLPFECYVAPRRDVDEMLLDAAVKWGVEVCRGYRVTGLIIEDGYVRGVRGIRHGVETELWSRVVIGADGAHSQVARATGMHANDVGTSAAGIQAYFRGVNLDPTLAKGQYEAYGVTAFDAGVPLCRFGVTPVGVAGVSEGLCSVAAILCDSEKTGAIDIRKRFEAWTHDRPEAKAMFAEASRVGEWRKGKLAYISRGTKICGDGFVLVGDAASVTMPLINDGLSAAADSAAVAADAVIHVMRQANAQRSEMTMTGSTDFSEAALTNAYIQAVKARKPAARLLHDADLKDRLKEMHLLAQSLHDPRVINRLIREGKIKNTVL